jgi:hypothetical protein
MKIAKRHQFQPNPEGLKALLTDLLRIVGLAKDTKGFLTKGDEWSRRIHSLKVDIRDLTTHDPTIVRSEASYMPVVGTGVKLRTHLEDALQGYLENGVSRFEKRVADIRAISARAVEERSRALKPLLKEFGDVARDTNVPLDDLVKRYNALQDFLDELKVLAEEKREVALQAERLAKVQRVEREVRDLAESL